ncbi:vacuolar protein sorting-associated protein 28 homolog 1-like [Phoenix dactylifera]|uniref:Vacuolar protein sorting-associated protein 28 homolog 1-like n=1 Tax=Phoenix dactylifera TaxID=42345 RepID=A0A8B8J0W4_PHODC|nr:vacuolar protein sorting-associated protein 28 homolog 1-like [Phoenix dactylifera]
MEVKLWNDKREREMLDSFADIYAIIKTTEKLECLQLIAQLKTLSFSLRDVVPSIDRFADAYKMDRHAALNRLLISGVPATVEHRAPSAAECVQHFITAMDSLKHNMILPLDFEGRVKVRGGSSTLILNPLTTHSWPPCQCMK